MDWLNIHIAKQIRSPAAIGSSPAELGTWVRVLAYCCEQENGGRIVGGAAWKDRQWQQTCAVTLRELKTADRLIQIDGNDVIVNGYPIEKEAEVQRARRRASAGAMARWGARESTCSSNAQACARADAEGEREREREVGKGTAAASPPCSETQQPIHPDEDTAQAPAPSRPARPAPMTDDWIAWKRSRRIFVARSDESGNQTEWRDLFRTAGAEVMTEGYNALIGQVPADRGLGFAALQRWIFQNYKESA